MNSPLGFDFSLYNNPVDFITDISSCNIHGRWISAEDLKKNFEKNELGIRNYRNLEKYFASIEQGNRIGDVELENNNTSFFRGFLNSLSCKTLPMTLRSLVTYDYWELVFFKKRFLFTRYLYHHDHIIIINLIIIEHGVHY